MKEVIFKHKIISTIVILCIAGGGYWWYQSANNASGASHYVLTEAVKGTVISSISGTGQVSASNQIDIKPEVAGQITYINIQKDSAVKAGTLLAQINSRDAQKAVQDAENNLASAGLSSQDISGTAKDNLDASYSNGLDALTTAFADLTSMKANLDSMFLDSSYKGSDSDINYYLNFVSFYDGKSSTLDFWGSDAKKKYNALQSGINSSENVAWALNKNSQSSQIKNSINDSYNSINAFLDLVRQGSALVQRYQKVTVDQSLTTPIQTATTTAQASQLNSALSLLVKDTAALLTAKTDITAKEQAFSKIGVDTQTQNLSILQYENALADAKDALAKYYIYAPIDGIISASDSTISNGNTVSSGTVLGSIITNQKVVGITLSEIDAVKVKVGQKVSITFDALPNFTATGSVIDIDSVGTVSQGVVSYGVKIALDVTDSQIKPGMSASVNIITDIKQNVLTVPNSAVKSKNGSYYVLVLNQKQDLTSAAASQGFISAVAPTQKAVEIGIADDTNTEIIGGLSEGDQVVTRTVSSTKTTATTTSSATSTATRQATRSLTGGGPPGGF